MGDFPSCWKIPSPGLYALLDKFSDGYSILAYLVEGDQNDPSADTPFKSLSCGYEDDFNDETFKDYKFVLDTVTSDEAASYYKETSGDNTSVLFRFHHIIL